MVVEEATAMTRGTVGRRTWMAGLSALLPFVLYLSSLQPGMGGSGDAIKFQFIGRILGIPHSPGYPGYVLLSHLFSWLPVGNLAYRINLMSAIFAALTCGLAYGIVNHLTESEWAALGTALLLGVSRVFWSHAVIAEVYALNAFYITATILALLIWEREREDRYLYLACAVYALSFGNHLSMITLLPAFGLFVLWTDAKAAAKPRSWLAIGLIVLAGASQYGFLWIRSHQGVAYSEMPANPTVRDFTWFITGGIFKGRMFALGLAEVLSERVPLYVGSLSNQFSRVGLALGLLGLYGMMVERRKHAVVLVVAFVSSLAFSLSYGIDYIYPFFVPSYILLGILAGYGLAALLRWIRSGPRWLRWASIVAVGLLLFMASFGAARTYYWLDRTRDAGTNEYVERVLSNIEGDSLLITRSYRTNVAFLYKLLGERKRAGEHVYSIVGPDRTALARSYWSNEPGVSSGYGTLDHLPRGLRVYTLEEHTWISSKEYEEQLVPHVYDDGEFEDYLGDLPEGTWVLLSTDGFALKAMGSVAQRAIRSLGLDVPDWEKGGIHFVSVAVVGSGTGSGEYRVGHGAARLLIRGGQEVAGREAPARISISSGSPTPFRRLEQLMSDLRQGRWEDALSATVFGYYVNGIVVNGRDYSLSGPGLNIVLLDPTTGEVIGRGTVDVLASNRVNEVVIYEVIPWNSPAD